LSKGAAARIFLTKVGTYDILFQMAELRKDPVSGNWVVVGYGRTQPVDINVCPFCPGNEHLTSPVIREFKDIDGSWLVRCFPASNPVFVIEVPEHKRAEGIFDRMGNVGANEIVVEGRSHTQTLSTFDERQLSLVLAMYRDRIIDLKKDKRFKYVQTFKNHGQLAGSYIFHPHSHVLATPILPQRIALELTNSQNHYKQKERCLFCDIITQELRQDKRVVAVNDGFAAFTPFAPRFPFEVWIAPRRHCDSFETMQDGEMQRDFIRLFLDVMKRIEKVAPSYTISIHTSPNEMGRGFVEENLPVSDYFHWHVEILPRDLRTSKYKREDEFYVISITPEETARLLKAEEV
jgi:UDPglucose--hexose-1-phosphate uridylyltransferase